MTWKHTTRKAWHSLMSIRRVFIQSKFSKAVPCISSPESFCFVLGNGPSLSDDIEKSLALLQRADVFVVGRLAESSLYQHIKPKYYVFADPTWWSTSAPEASIRLRNSLFETIRSRTSWNLTILAPFEAKEYFTQIFGQHPSISTIFHNNTVATGFQSLRFDLYKMFLAAPPAHTVLVSALFLGVNMGYKNITLLGADHSWHETIALDESNRVCVRDKHFYDNDAPLRPFSMDGSDNKIFRMDSLFNVMGKMFEGHWEIAEYALFRGASITNASSVTYIDAYQRASIDVVVNRLSESIY